jgi:general L-amino acid transport system permease protein
MTDVTQDLPLVVEPPPPATAGLIGWLRANLFSGVFNSILTILAAALLAVTIPPIIRWALLDAVWTAPNSRACRGAGACWAFIHEKLRFILFGTYPYEEHWRPQAVGPAAGAPLARGARGGRRPDVGRNFRPELCRQ